jgi:hypothetical protein
VSDADLFIKKFDAEHPEHSKSQVQEIKKHQRIFHRSTDQRIKW